LRLNGGLFLPQKFLQALSLQLHIVSFCSIPPDDASRKFCGWCGLMAALAVD
jgi:hypothetical protein